MSELILTASYYVNKVQTYTDVSGTYFVMGNTAQQDVLIPVTYEVMDVPWRDLESRLEIINRADQQSTVIARRKQRYLSRYTVAQPPAFETVLYPDRDLLIRRDFPRIAWANLENASLRTDWTRKVVREFPLMLHFSGQPMDLIVLHFDLSQLGTGKRIVGAELIINQIGYASPFLTSWFDNHPYRFDLAAMICPIAWDESSTWQTFVDAGVNLEYWGPLDLSYANYYSPVYYPYPDLADRRYGIIPKDSQQLSVVLPQFVDRVTQWYEQPESNLGVIIGAGKLYAPQLHPEYNKIMMIGYEGWREEDAPPYPWIPRSLKLNVGLSANKDSYYRPKLVVRWQYATYSQTVFDFGSRTTVRLSDESILAAKIRTGVTSNLESRLQSSLPNLRSQADVYIPNDIEGRLYVNLRGLSDQNSSTYVSRPNLASKVSAQRGGRSNLNTTVGVRKATQEDQPTQVSVRVGTWQEVNSACEVPPHSNFPTLANVSVPDLSSRVTSVESSYLNSRIDIMTDGKNELPAQTEVRTYPGEDNFSSQIGVQWEDKKDLPGRVRAWIVSENYDVDSLVWVPRRINQIGNLTSKLVVYPYDPSGTKGSNLMSRLQPKPPYVAAGWLDSKLFVMSTNVVLSKIGVRRWKYLYSRFKVKTNAEDNGIQGQVVPRVYNVEDMLVVMQVKNGISDLNSQLHAGPYTITSGTTVYSWPPVGEHDEPGGGS